jgi:DNA-directed RNA polymerase subunit RPC12/RpoP
MTKVEIDDLNCTHCKKITLGELDIKTRKYTCMKCGREV